MNARDAGWIQIYAENNQEAYDNYLQAMPIAEHPGSAPAHHDLPGRLHHFPLRGKHRTFGGRKGQGLRGRIHAGKITCSSTKIPWPWGPTASAPITWKRKWPRPRPWSTPSRSSWTWAAATPSSPVGTTACLKATAWKDAEEAVVLIGSSAGTARVCVDQLRERRPQSRHDQGAGLPPLPRRGTGRGAAKRSGRGRARTSAKAIPPTAVLWARSFAAPCTTLGCTPC